MNFSAIVICIIGILGILLLFTVARRALRLVVRLALVGVILVAIAGGGLYLWWNGWFGTSEKPGDARPTPTRRANTH